MSTEDKRYSVVWHDDKRGKWYSIVDKQSGEHIAAYRSRKSAHNYCAYRNSIDLTRAHGGRRFRPNPPQYVGEREGA